MTILEMIQEWEKGCSNTVGEHPCKCEECTLGLIRAIKNKVVEEQRNDRSKKLAAHCEKAAREIATWPEWKQRIVNSMFKVK